MLRIETKTKLPPEDVMKRASKYFRGYKLKVLDESPGCGTYEGGGGGVHVDTKTADGVTTVEFVSREWDQQVKDFIELLPERVPYK
jgi:hypothetical protein